MKYHVHFKNELGRDDTVTVEAGSELEAERLGAAGDTVSVVVGAYPADPLPWHDVTVHWPDGSSHEDGIRGVDRDDALANAASNWIFDNPYGQAARIEYRGEAR